MAAPSRRPRPRPTSPPARCDFDRCVCPLTLTGRFCALLGSGSWHAGAAVAIFLEFVWQTATNGLAQSVRTPGRPRAPLGPPIELVSPFIGSQSQRLTRPRGTSHTVTDVNAHPNRRPQSVTARHQRPVDGIGSPSIPTDPGRPPEPPPARPPPHRVAPHASTPAPLKTQKSKNSPEPAWPSSGDISRICLADRNQWPCPAAPDPRLTSCTPGPARRACLAVSGIRIRRARPSRRHLRTPESTFTVRDGAMSAPRRLSRVGWYPCRPWGATPPPAATFHLAARSADGSKQLKTRPRPPKVAILRTPETNTNRTPS